MTLKLKIGFIFFSIFFGLNLCLPVYSQNPTNLIQEKTKPKVQNDSKKPIGAECTSNSDCDSGDCESSDIEKASGDDLAYCDCGDFDSRIGLISAFSENIGSIIDNESEYCKMAYGNPKDNQEIWYCKDGSSSSHDLDYCVSTKGRIEFPLEPTVSTFLDYIFDTEAALKKGGADLLQKPDVRIKIPGLNFSDVSINGQADGQSGTTLQTPFLAEYVASIYRYVIVIAGIIATIMIIIGGLQWIMSGGEGSMVEGAKKKIGGAIVGLLLALGSYTILYTVNPDLVKFKNLGVTMVDNSYIDWSKTFLDDNPIPDYSQSIPGKSEKSYKSPKYDELFKAFGNCIGVNYNFLKAMAFLESRFNPSNVNPISGYGGLMQTSRRGCTALKQQEWKSICSIRNIFNPGYNTAIASSMMIYGNKLIEKRCGTNFNEQDYALLLWLNHNSGGGSLAVVLSNLREGNCETGDALREKYIAEIKRRGQPDAEKRYQSGLTIYGWFRDLSNGKGIFDTSDNGNAQCPLSSDPDMYLQQFSSEQQTPSDQSLADANVVCTPQGAGGHKVLVLGDSITVNANSYADILRSSCQQHGIVIEKRAQQSLSAEDVFNRFYKDYDIQGQNFTDLIVLAGVNGISSVAQTKAGLTQIYQKAKADGLRVIAITITPWWGYRGNSAGQLQDKTLEINTWIRSRPAGLGANDIIIDGYALLEDPQKPGHLKPEYDDGGHIHFNQKGHQVIAAAIARQAFSQ